MSWADVPSGATSGTASAKNADMKMEVVVIPDRRVHRQRQGGGVGSDHHGLGVRGFIFSPDPTTKSLGFALALGVLIDAFVIRMTVVPATMYVYGKSAWWLPKWLARILPDLDIEGRNLSVPTGSTPKDVYHDAV